MVLITLSLFFLIDSLPHCLHCLAKMTSTFLKHLRSSFNLTLSPHFFKLYFIDYAISCPDFPPFAPLHLAFPTPSDNPHTICSCPWVTHISSLATPFPILYCISPWLFYLYCLIPSLLHIFPHKPLPSGNHQNAQVRLTRLEGNVKYLNVAIGCQTSGWKLKNCIR